MTAAAAPSNAINIHVFRNGDSYYKGRKFVVNQRQTRNFESFLSMVTTGVRPQYGAVRRLYTPTHGHKVNLLSDLENNKHYVAAGMEHFRPVQYFSIGRPDVHKHPNLQRSIIKPVVHSRIKVSARVRKPPDGPKVIHVYRNGDTLYPSVRLLLTKRMMFNWDTVLQIVTDRVNLVNGAVWRLWHMDGRRMIELSEIENEGTYVASGNERFKKVAYGISGPLEPSSPRIRRPTPPAKKRPTLLVSRKHHRVSPRTLPTKKTPRKPAQPKPPDKNKRKEKTAAQKEAETVFHSRPAIVKRSRGKEGSAEARLDFEEGEKGVFKAKETRQETRGATEVTETQDTAVDLPIDQVKAEEVDDELGEESHDQLGNHVTQSGAHGVVIKQEKDAGNPPTMNGAEVVKELGQDGQQQLNHVNAVPPTEQGEYTADNYNNNQSHDFEPGEPQIESTHRKEGTAQEIAEELEDADVEEGLVENASLLAGDKDNHSGTTEHQAEDPQQGLEERGDASTDDQAVSTAPDGTDDPAQVVAGEGAVRGRCEELDMDREVVEDLDHVTGVPVLDGDNVDAAAGSTKDGIKTNSVKDDGTNAINIGAPLAVAMSNTEGASVQEKEADTKPEGPIPAAKEIGHTADGESVREQLTFAITTEQTKTATVVGVSRDTDTTHTQ